MGNLIGSNPNRTGRWARALGEVGNRALDLLFPPCCLVCHAKMMELPSGISFCNSCYKRIVNRSNPVCLRCGARVPAIPGPSESCPNCVSNRLKFDRTFFLGSYERELRDLILQMKDDQSRQIVVALGRALARECKSELVSIAPEAVVPIPMHPWRSFTRGTDAVRALAEVVAAELGLPCHKDLLAWKRNSSAQLGLSKPGRFRNVQGAMQIRTGYQLDAARMIVVDDILTTGATCSEAARILKRGGASHTTVIVLGRTFDR